MEMGMHGSGKGQTVHLLISVLHLIKEKWTNFPMLKACINKMKHMERVKSYQTG